MLRMACTKAVLHRSTVSCWIAAKTCALRALRIAGVHLGDCCVAVVGCAVVADVHRWTFGVGRDGGCCGVRAIAQKQWRRQEQDQELSRRSARVTFVLAKVTKTAPARHEPVRYSRTGALRSSRRAARRPNSLRSNKGASSAARHCGARLALRREVLRATAHGNSKSNSNSSRATAKGSKRERRLHSNGGRGGGCSFSHRDHGPLFGGRCPEGADEGTGEASCAQTPRVASRRTLTPTPLPRGRGA
ncbi:hypothetical protein HEP75_03924 [Xanthomonas sp. SI]|nr:hypothetical protein HEP75_03924 [Xanthomonas sp. SI]